MKKIIMALLLCLGMSTVAMAQGSKRAENYAVIKFDTLKCNLGTFSEKNPIRKCTFNFRNTGTAPLIINQAFASCGCTVPDYSTAPIKPGATGKIDVTYEGKFPGRFVKTITVRSNAKNEIVRLTIEGVMTD